MHFQKNLANMSDTNTCIYDSRKMHCKVLTPPENSGVLGWLAIGVMFSLVKIEQCTVISIVQRPQVSHIMYLGPCVTCQMQNSSVLCVEKFPTA